MAVAGDRILNPHNEGYATHEITDETPANGRKQAALLVKMVGDDGATSAPATAANQASELTLIGAVTETAPATDTASSGLNGRLQRIAQRVTSVITLLAGGLPAALSAGGGVKAGIVDALPAGTNNIGDVDVLTQVGAANLGNNQVTAGSTSDVVVAPRATRRSVLIRNTDAANSAYVGTGTVTSGNGFLLKAGESISIETTAAVNSIRATSDVVLAYCEVWD